MLLLRRFARDLQGATAIEYCMIAGLISIAVLVGATSIGTHLLSAYFTSVSNGLN